MPTALAIFAITISVFTGYLIVTLSQDRRQNNFKPGLALRIFIGVAVGNGVYSLTAFVWQVIFGRYYPVYIFLELLIFAILLILWLRRAKELPAAAVDPRTPVTNLGRFLALIFAVTCLMGLAAFISGALLFPQGSSDAWNIWNMGARFLFFGNGSWQNAFSPLLLHSDYPLFWAVSIARIWRYSQSADQIVPILFSLVFLVAITGLVVSSVGQFRGRQAGWLAGLTLFCANALFILAPTQCVDIPMSLFILSSVILLYIYNQSPQANPRNLLLAGFTAAACAWLKNEGWLFILVITFVYFGLMGLFRRKFSWRELSWWGLGALPALAVALYFKLAFAPQNDLVGGMSASTLLKFADAGRYQLILSDFAAQLVKLDPKYSTPALALPIVALLMGTRPLHEDNMRFLQSISLIGLMLAGYFLIYLVTPRDLDWHLTTSLYRLFLQLWPLMVFETCMLIKFPKTLPF
jgi:hypothetical protein